jgi:hypothetical protein
MSTAISLATIPGRESGLYKSLECLRNQTIKLPIYVYSPEVLKRAGRCLDQQLIKNIVDQFEDVNLFITKEDNGSIDKIYHALDLPFDNIITVDDDMFYPNMLVEQLLLNADKHPNTALCYRGKQLKGQPYDQTQLLEGNRDRKYPNNKTRHVFNVRVDIITGVWGALYPRKLIDKDALLKLSKQYPTTDDIVISYILAECNVDRLLVHLPKRPKPLPQHEVYELYKINKNKKKNDVALNNLFYKTR